MLKTTINGKIRGRSFCLNLLILHNKNRQKMYEIIIINGKDFPVRYGMAALMDFTKKTNIKVNELDKLGQEMTIEAAIALCWAGLKNGARKAGKEFELTLLDVADLIDDDESVITKCMEIFQDQYNTSTTTGNEVGAKKAPTKKK